MRALAVTAAILVFSGAFVSAGAGDTPTYNKDVGKLLLDNCASCHRPDQVAPMSLLSYKDARPWARAIKAKVEAREMPPWFADPRFGKFSNDSSLSDDEIATVVAWVDAGAPEGDGVAPEPPQFADSGWSHPSGLPPDFIYEFPVEWHIDAEGETPNFNLYTPLPFDDAMWVTGTEVHPGNRAVTHHITTGLRNIPAGMKVGTGPVWPGGPTADYVLVPDTDPDPDPDREAADSDVFQEVADRFARGEGGEEFSTGFGLYVPGQNRRNVKEGHVQAIRGDLFSHVRWNLHYQATGKPETARPSIAAWTASEPDHVKLARRQIQVKEYTSEGRTLVAPPPLSPEEAREFAARFEVNQDLNPLLAPIPPHDANWTVTGIGAFQNDSFLQDVWLHAHTRGKDFTCVLTYPDGREEIVLRVANYSFDWQYRYYFEEPLLVPAGSTLKVIARYDNSRANRQNPAPHRPTYWSEQSWDDMFVVNAGYTLAEDEEAGAGQN